MKTPSLFAALFPRTRFSLGSAPLRAKSTGGPCGGLALALAVLLSPSSARAQCASDWIAGAGVPGLDQIPYVMTTWDRDGAGPLPAVVVAGGQFTSAGGVPASKIALWDPSTGVWSALGSGMNDYVISLAVMPNGDLIAGGAFSTAGGVPARGLARWNGTAWADMGVDLQVPNALAVLPNGDLVAGGTFYFANFVQVNFVTRWDGTSWLPMGTGMNDHVHALAVLPGGDLVAAGYFTTAGGTTVNRIARWNGAAWSPLSTGMDSNVFSLALLPGGQLIAGGSFQSAGGIPANRIAAWNGASWSALGSGMGPFGAVRALAVLGASGDLVAGGQFNTAGGVGASNIARWNGSAWSALGSGLDVDVRSLAVLPGGDFAAGGNFTTAGGMPAARFAFHAAGALPAAYCIAKLNSLGCLPAISSSGSPSATAGSGFSVHGSNVRNQKSGLLLYGLNGQSTLPFQGGTLCVASPVRRTPGVSSGGSATGNDCTGVYTIDFNAFAAGSLGGTPPSALQTPGTVVDAQWWGRDPGFVSPNNTTLTDGLHFTLCP
jgi:hypothetical protein